MGSLRRMIQGATRRVLGGVALTAQVLGLLAPVAEFRASVPTVAYTASAVVHSSPITEAGRAHNPDTCPACIARSLHARPSTTIGLGLVLSESPTAVDLHDAGAVQQRSTPSYHSRAPPATLPA